MGYNSKMLSKGYQEKNFSIPFGLSSQNPEMRLRPCGINCNQIDTISGNTDPSYDKRALITRDANCECLNMKDTAEVELSSHKSQQTPKNEIYLEDAFYGEDYAKGADMENEKRGERENFSKEGDVVDKGKQLDFLEADIGALDGKDRINNNKGSVDAKGLVGDDGHGDKKLGAHHECMKFGGFCGAGGAGKGDDILNQKMVLGKNVFGGSLEGNKGIFSEVRGRTIATGKQAATKEFEETEFLCSYKDCSKSFKLVNF